MHYNMASQINGVNLTFDALVKASQDPRVLVDGVTSEKLLAAAATNVVCATFTVLNHVLETVYDADSLEESVMAGVQESHNADADAMNRFLWRQLRASYLFGELYVEYSGIGQFERIEALLYNAAVNFFKFHVDVQESAVPANHMRGAH